MKSPIFLIVVLFNFIVATASARENEFFDAVNRGDLEMVENLISNRTNVNAFDNDGETALIVASRNGHTEIAEFLITKGANVNAVTEYGKTALMYASSEGHTETVIFLIEKGADVTAVSDDKTTALELASVHRHAEIVELLNKEIITEKIFVIILFVLIITILILLFKGKAINKRIGYKISGVLAIILYTVYVLIQILLNNANIVENILRTIEGILIVLVGILFYKGEAIDKLFKFRISDFLKPVLLAALLAVWVWITFFY